MKFVQDRIAALSMYSTDGLCKYVSLVVHQIPNPSDPGAPWIAAITCDGGLMPLLDSNGDQSLAAAGSSPMGAMTMLNEKLRYVP